MNHYNEESEKNLLAMVKEKEESDKRLLMLEIVIGVLSVVFLFVMIAIGYVFVSMYEKMWVFWLLFGIGLVQFIICTLFALRIEQVAGYYECQKCGHRYVPSYMSVNMAMHMGRTRYMKCPHCGKRSWQKKVLSKEEHKD